MHLNLVDRGACPLLQIEADNKMKRGIEQVGRVVYPSCFALLDLNQPAGVNHPSQLVLFEVCVEPWLLLQTVVFLR